MSHAYQHRMNVAEFHLWTPPGGMEDRRWELVDGEPVCMAPPGLNHGAIQNQTGRLLANHLDQHRPDCRVITTPGVVPRASSINNERVPDLGISCGPMIDARTMAMPILLIEILSPSNEAKTRANVWAYCTIPSVREILLLSSSQMKAELLSRDILDQWPDMPTVINAGEDLHLTSIGFSALLDEFYRTSSFFAVR